ncbi:MAG: Ppx/GppA family phosphatase [Anaerolineae bacterium]|nr:Ppx/GppA family phosphatase [Anaerolineae bacterium]
MSRLKQLDTLAAHSDVYKDSQRVAIIDLGSNSFRLIVIEYVPHLSFRMVDEVAESVRLSEGMGEADILRAAAMDRAARAVQIYGAFCKASGITDIIAAGTSAIRDAKNQQPFLTRLKAETGINVRVLSGEEEAYYGYLAAVNSTPLENGFVLDMGGGSVQVSRVKKRELRESISLPLGAVRMTEQFLKSDPATEKEIDNLRDYLEKQFRALDWFKHRRGMELVAEGGGVRLMGRLAQKMDGYPLDMAHGYQLTASKIKTIRNLLAERSVQERKRLPGMKPERADISLGGAMVIHEALRASGFDELTISEQGLRGGLFYERFLTGTDAPLFEHVRQASVLNLAHLYRFQEQHAQHIAHLTLSMFDQLPADVHQCGANERELLWAASMLHDIGVAVDYNDHHKHSAYLILNAGLPGYSHREIALIALLARYHRKGQPKLDEFASLVEPGDDRRLLQLCALLRLAEQIDRSRDGVARDVTLTTGAGWAQLALQVRGDGQVALWSVERHRDIFQQAFGLELEVVLSSELSTEY